MKTNIIKTAVLVVNGLFVINATDEICVDINDNIIALRMNEGNNRIINNYQGYQGGNDRFMEDDEFFDENLRKIVRNVKINDMEIDNNNNENNNEVINNNREKNVGNNGVNLVGLVKEDFVDDDSEKEKLKESNNEEIEKLKNMRDKGEIIVNPFESTAEDEEGKEKKERENGEKKKKNPDDKHNDNPFECC